MMVELKAAGGARPTIMVPLEGIGTGEGGGCNEMESSYRGHHCGQVWTHPRHSPSVRGRRRRTRLKPTGTAAGSHPRSVASGSPTRRGRRTGEVPCAEPGGRAPVSARRRRGRLPAAQGTPHGHRGDPEGRSKMAKVYENPETGSSGSFVDVDFYETLFAFLVFPLSLFG